MQCSNCKGKGYVFLSENKEDCPTCGSLGKVCDVCEGILIESELKGEVCEDCIAYSDQKADELKHPDEENR